jgi:hypothetical protein
VEKDCATVVIFPVNRRHLGQRDPTLKSCKNRGHRKLARGVQRQTWRRGNLQKNEGRA